MTPAPRRGKVDPGPAPGTDVARLQEQNEYKTQLLNSVAHELSTPLTPIRLQLQFLQSGRHGVMNAEQHKALDVVSRNVNRLSGLVKDLLDVARLDSKRFPIEFVATDLSQVVTEAMDSFQDPAKAAGVRLEAHFVKGLQALADGRRLVQVLYNLISNAIKFTPPGGTIKVELVQDDGSATVSVTDTGVGFRPEDADKLFKPFSQLDSGTAGAYAGHGLGLFISHGIIELHGGTIWGTSPGLGRGATFAFTIPLQAEGINGPPVTRTDIDVGGRDDAFARRIRSLL